MREDDLMRCSKTRKGLTLLVLPVLIAVLVLVPAPRQAQAGAGDIVLCSSNASGAYADLDGDNCDISADGRYVVFHSRANNLVGPSATAQVYRKDLLTGQVQLCSANASGAPANDWSGSPSISADGRYVAFGTSSTNLVAGLNGNDQIVRKDMNTGQVMICSANASGIAGNGDSAFADITPDGRYVAFWGDSTNLVTPASSGTQVFRKDLQTGEARLCSVNASTVQGNAISRDVSISESGRYVAFYSQANNLLPGVSGQQVYRKDLLMGELKLCSANASAVQGNGVCSMPDISPTGDFVAFESNSTNLVPGGTTDWEVFRKDMQTGEVMLCSANASGAESNFNSFHPSISADGRYVAFYTSATNMVTPATSNWQVFRKDMQTKEVVLVSANPSGVQGNGTAGSETMTQDGRYVVFQSYSDNFVTPTTDHQQIFRKELTAPITYYFAEGYTGANFQEYLCLGNPSSAPIDVTVTYLFSGQPAMQKTYNVAAGSRFTANINAEVGPDRDVSMQCQAGTPFIAERPMYFSYGAGGWTGGHDVVGASMPAYNWYFAEGYTGAGFDEWICVLNPGPQVADLTFRFQTQEEGEKVVTGFSVPGGYRQSFKANDLLGGKSYQTSLALESTRPVVAERPMYFNYQGTAGWNWTGGHCVMGAYAMSNSYYFAEGTTRAGFEEWITLQNPGTSDISIHATYQLGSGAPVEKDYPVAAGRRSTILVNSDAVGVGPNKDVSVFLTCASPFLAERPMYFDYQGLGSWGWTGGHCVIGAAADAMLWYFAEGYTGTGFEEWLCIQNPGTKDATVTVTYYPETGTPKTTTHTAVANSRYNIPVNVDAGSGLTISAKLSANEPVIVERPMYFDFQGKWTGGHDVVGYAP